MQRWLLIAVTGAITLEPAVSLAQGEDRISPLLASMSARLSPPGEAIPDPPTRFQPRPRNIAALTAALTEDPGQRASIGALLETVFAAYESSAAKQGLENDLAGAIAFNIATNYAAYKGSAALPESGMGLMARQIQAALDTAAMRAAKDAEKQQLYETYIMMAGLLAARIQNAEGDAEAAQTVKGLGAEGLRHLLRVDPKMVRITDAGLSTKPASAAPAAPAGKLKTLLFSAPGWTRKDAGDGITLEMRKESFYDNGVTVVVLSGALPMAGSLQQTSRKYWREQILSILEGKDNPFVMTTLIGSGLRSGFIQADMKAKQTGASLSVTCYIVDAGSKVYPVMILTSGYIKEQVAALEQLVKSFRIPGGAPPAKPLATNAQLGRNWSTTASSVTNYVNAYNGSPAGTSIVAYGKYFAMKPNGTYTSTFSGISNSLRIKEKEKGTYKLQGDILLFRDATGRTSKNRFLGIDTPPGATTPIMLLLNPQYPLRAGNIGLYGEKYGVKN